MKRLKKYGQHFLEDPAAAARIAAALETVPGDHIVEVGPGAGMLTGYLAQQPFARLQLVELDPRWAAFLRERYEGRAGIEVHNADILKYDFPKEGRPVRLAGNIPYYITSPLLFRMLDNHRHIRRAVLMVQKEVAQRLTAGCGNRDYGITTVFLAAFGRAEKLFDIGREHFRPVPGVDSSVIRIDFDRTPDDIENYEMFTRLVRGTFQTRRKKLKNSIERLTGPEVAARIRSVDLNRRPEELSPERFRTLANEVYRLSR